MYYQGISKNPTIATENTENTEESAEFANHAQNFVPPCLCESNKEKGNIPQKKLEAPERNLLLLSEIGDNPLRTARFVCAMVLLCSTDRFFIAQETFEGEIVKGPECIRGTGGFGYDPILFIPDFGRTVAELSEKEKNTVSHRAKAGKIISTILKTF